MRGLPILLLSLLLQLSFSWKLTENENIQRAESCGTWKNARSLDRSPWVVSIWHSVATLNITGFLISDRHVITAANGVVPLSTELIGKCEDRISALPRLINRNWLSINDISFVKAWYIGNCSFFQDFILFELKSSLGSDHTPICTAKSDNIINKEMMIYSSVHGLTENARWWENGIIEEIACPGNLSICTQSDLLTRNDLGGALAILNSEGRETALAVVSDYLTEVQRHVSITGYSQQICDVSGVCSLEDGPTETSEYPTSEFPIHPEVYGTDETTPEEPMESEGTPEYPRATSEFPDYPETMNTDYPDYPVTYETRDYPMETTGYPDYPETDLTPSEEPNGPEGTPEYPEYPTSEFPIHPEVYGTDETREYPVEYSTPSDEPRDYDTTPEYPEYGTGRPEVDYPTDDTPEYTEDPDYPASQETEPPEPEGTPEYPRDIYEFPHETPGYYSTSESPDYPGTDGTEDPSEPTPGASGYSEYPEEGTSGPSDYSQYPDPETYETRDYPMETTDYPDYPETDQTREYPEYSTPSDEPRDYETTPEYPEYGTESPDYYTTDNYADDTTEYPDYPEPTGDYPVHPEPTGVFPVHPEVPEVPGTQEETTEFPEYSMAPETGGTPEYPEYGTSEYPDYPETEQTPDYPEPTGDYPVHPEVPEVSGTQETPEVEYPTTPETGGTPEYPEYGTSESIEYPETDQTPDYPEPTEDYPVHPEPTGDFPVHPEVNGTHETPEVKYPTTPEQPTLKVPTGLGRLSREEDKHREKICGRWTNKDDLYASVYGHFPAIRVIVYPTPNGFKKASGIMISSRHVLTVADVVFPSGYRNESDVECVNGIIKSDRFSEIIVPSRWGNYSVVSAAYIGLCDEQPRTYGMTIMEVEKDFIDPHAPERTPFCVPDIPTAFYNDSVILYSLSHPYWRDNNLFDSPAVELSVHNCTGPSICVESGFMDDLDLGGALSKFVDGREVAAGLVVKHGSGKQGGQRQLKISRFHKQICQLSGVCPFTPRRPKPTVRPSPILESSETSTSSESPEVNTPDEKLLAIGARIEELCKEWADYVKSKFSAIF